jgi:hypothetical protein
MHTNGVSVRGNPGGRGRVEWVGTRVTVRGRGQEVRHWGRNETTDTMPCQGRAGMRGGGCVWVWPCVPENTELDEGDQQGAEHDGAQVVPQGAQQSRPHRQPGLRLHTSTRAHDTAPLRKKQGDNGPTSGAVPPSGARSGPQVGVGVTGHNVQTSWPPPQADCSRSARSTTRRTRPPACTRPRPGTMR